MSWFNPDTADPHGYASSLQPSQDNPPATRGGPLSRYEIYGSSATPQSCGWNLRSASERSTDELEFSGMPKLPNFPREVSSSDLSNSPRYILSPDLDASVDRNGKDSRAMEYSDLEKDFGSYPAPSRREASLINQRHYCRSEGCSHTKGFARFNDLKRHQKKHNGGTPLWYCGCCKNMGDDGYKGTLRKDHLKQHLTIKHQMETHHSCPESLCSGRGRILFSSGACVEEHLRQEHGYKSTGEATSSGCSCSKKKTEGLSIALKNSENVSTQTAPRATDKSGRSSPARSQAIKRLIQADSESLPKRRRQDSTYSSCDVSEVASTEIVSTENTSITVEDISRSLGSFIPTESPNKKYMPPDSLGFSITTALESPTYERQLSLDVESLYLPEFIESSFQDDWGQLDDFIRVPTNLHPNADSVLRPYESDSLVPLGLEEVPNVHPADFLALYRTKSLSLEISGNYADRIEGSHKIQEFLTAAVKFLETAEITSFSYNPRTRTINLRGPVTLIKSAKDRLQAVMLEVSRESGVQYLQRKQKELQRKAKVNPIHGTWNTLAHQTCDGNISANIFALRVQQDSITITTWIEVLLPNLPTILDPAIGQDYTASLVRQGASEVVARPHVRIQSPRKLRWATRKSIKHAIDELCKSNSRACIPVSFLMGYLRLLANATSLQPVIEENSWSTDSEEEDDDPDFDTKRYWQNPGMGASIGMRCTKLVSATLGGYVLVDGRKFLLTVDHFIERSHKENFTASPSLTRDLFTLTSPSLSDVDEMRERFDETIRAVKERSKMLSKKPGDSEISLEDELPPEMQGISEELDLIEEYQSEIDRPEQDFVLGELAGRCKPNVMLTLDAESPSPPESAINCRMDWAMFSIENHRMGENRHRFQPGSGIEMAETTSETNPNWTGSGEFCNDTCDLEPNAFVHYVGQRSGPRKGQINAVPMLLKSGGISSKEWALICPEQISRSEGCEGDSGAWVLRDSDNKLVGLLWGWIDGQLLFSPINKVFADIKTTFLAREVGLPRDPINQEPPVMSISGNAAPEPVLICAVKKPKTAKPYKLSTLLRSKSSLQAVSRAKASIENEAVSNQGTSSAFETQDIAGPSGRQPPPIPSLPSYDPVSSDSSMKLDITSLAEHSSPSGTADISSLKKLSTEKNRQQKCKKTAGFVHRQDGNSTTDQERILIMHEQRKLARSGSVDPEYVSHAKRQSPLPYILLPVSTNLLAFDTTFPSKSQPMKLGCKSSTFPFSQRDTAAQLKSHEFNLFNNHLRSGKRKDLSQSQRMLATMRRMVEIFA